MRRYRVLAIDLVLIGLATVCALLLRENLEISWARFDDLLPYLVQTLLIAAIILPALGTDKILWRFSGLPDYFRLAGACALTVLVSVGLGFAIFRMDGGERQLP